MSSAPAASAPMTANPEASWLDVRPARMRSRVVDLSHDPPLRLCRRRRNGGDSRLCLKPGTAVGGVTAAVIAARWAKIASRSASPRPSKGRRASPPRFTPAVSTCTSAIRSSRWSTPCLSRTSCTRVSGMRRSVQPAGRCGRSVRRRRSSRRRCSSGRATKRPRLRNTQCDRHPAQVRHVAAAENDQRAGPGRNSRAPRVPPREEQRQRVEPGLCGRRSARCGCQWKGRRRDRDRRRHLRRKGVGGAVKRHRPPPGRDQTVAQPHRLVGVQPRQLDRRRVPCRRCAGSAWPGRTSAGAARGDVHVLEPRQRQELDATGNHTPRLMSSSGRRGGSPRPWLPRVVGRKSSRRPAALAEPSSRHPRQRCRRTRLRRRQRPAR